MNNSHLTAHVLALCLNIPLGPSSNNAPPQFALVFPWA